MSRTCHSWNRIQRTTRGGLVLLSILPACVTSSAVSLNPGTKFLPPSPLQIPLTVGFYASPELRSRKYTFGISGMDSRFVIPIGEASAQLFKEVTSAVFSQSVVVHKRPPLPVNPLPTAAVLELTLEDSKIDARPFLGVGGRNLCWAEIIYRFTVHSTSGTELAKWHVRGIGERVGSVLDARLFADTVELAMRDAAEKFQTSFFDAPEARRWVRNLPATDVNAPAEGQITLKEQKPVWLGFLGVTAANVEFARDAQAPNILSAKVQVSNRGERRLFVRPLDTSVEIEGGSTARSAPASELAASVSPQFVRLPPLGYGPGFTFGGPPEFAVGNFVSILINLSIIEAENKKIEEAVSKYRIETLRDVTLWPGESVDFVVHYIGVPSQGAAKHLTVPVIDLDTATRYIIRLPVP